MAWRVLVLLVPSLLPLGAVAVGGVRTWEDKVAVDHTVWGRGWTGGPLIKHVARRCIMQHAMQHSTAAATSVLYS